MDLNLARAQQMFAVLDVKHLVLPGGMVRYGVWTWRFGCSQLCAHVVHVGHNA